MLAVWDNIPDFHMETLIYDSFTGIMVNCEWKPLI